LNKLADALTVTTIVPSKGKLFGKRKAVLDKYSFIIGGIKNHSIEESRDCVSLILCTRNILPPIFVKLPLEINVFEASS
jgi:hypothetical protein